MRFLDKKLKARLSAVPFWEIRPAQTSMLIPVLVSSNSCYLIRLIQLFGFGTPRVFIWAATQNSSAEERERVFEMHQLEELQHLEELEQEHVDRVVQILTNPCTPTDGLAEVAHDARNMVTALELYCDLVEEPGVFAAPFAHYGRELRLIAAASRRLVEKLATLGPESPAASFDPVASVSALDLPPESRLQPSRIAPIHPITNLAEELLTNRNLLASLAGPTITLSVDVEGGAVPVRMSAEDLTRILVNLVKNAAEAMSAVGRIHIGLWETGEKKSDRVTLNVEDNGPGLSDRILQMISEPVQSFTDRDAPSTRHRGQFARHGLGLAITRSIIEAAGGTMRAMNRDPVGASIQLELPISTPAMPPGQVHSNQG